MKKNILVASAAVALSVALGEPSGDRPDATHAWAVHDVNRPDPVRVEVGANGIPSDALVLFDGSAQSIVRNWKSEKGGPSKWTLKDGCFVCVPGSGSALTKEEFGDCQLHLEFMTPKDDRDGWGNSGVIFMGQYEIQVLDSSDVRPSRSPFKAANYADGQCGAVYGQNPPIVQPCRKPGAWQTYDIVFHPPLWEGERLVDPGSATVFLNGVLVQDDFPFQGRTTWCRRLPHSTLKAGSLRLQDHGHPVPYRNIWIRRIPSRFADTVNGGLGVKRGDVATLRHRLAQESLDFAAKADDPAEKFIRLWESFCYEPNRKVEKQIASASAALIAALEKKDPRVTSSDRFGCLKRFVRMLVASRFLSADAPVAKAVEAFAAPKKPKVRTVNLVETAEGAAALTLGEEFPGAKGSVTPLCEENRPLLRLTADLKKGAYVGMEFREKLPEGSQRIRLDCRVRSAAPTARVFFRFPDRDQQFHIQSVTVSKRDVWQTVEFDLHRSAHHWGKKVSDGVVRLPGAGFAVGLELRGEGDRTGTLDLRKVELVTTADEAALPSTVVRLAAPRFGGLYRPDETVEIGWRRFVRDGSPRADERRMTVTDFQGKPVCTRALAKDAASGLVRFAPQELGGRFGAFCVRVGAAETWFARLTTAGDPKPCRWIGTVTHGAHGWRHGDFRYLDLLTASGIGIVRDEINWGTVETAKGVYRLPENFVRLVDELRRRGIRFNNLLNARNPVYENPLDPEAFARYCAWHVRALGERCDLYEIFNEPQNFGFYQVYRDVYGYGKRDERGNPDLPWIPRFVDFTRKAVSAIRAANPAAEVVVCAEDGVPLLHKMLELGIATPKEIVSIHNYDHRHYPPEGDWFNKSDGRDLRDFGRRYGAVRFASTEDGWTTYRGGPGGEYAFVGNYPPCNPEQQARYVVRMFLTGRQNGLEYLTQYDFKDDGPRRNYTEHNFGLVYEDYSPKPSFSAVAHLTRMLGAAEPAGDAGTDHARYRLYRFRQPDGTMTYAGWAIEGALAVARPAELAGDVTVTDMFGNPQPGVVAGAGLNLTENPVYFRGNPR